MTLRYDEFEVLSFDCYGTLIDWEAGLLEALRPWRRRVGADASDDALLGAFARHESKMQRARPRLLYPDLLAAVLGAISEELGAPASAAERGAFGASVGDWPAFPDSAGALAALKRDHRLCILSNVDKASFSRSAERLRAAFDHVFTAEEIGSYKPDPRNFRFMLDRLAEAGTPAARVLHVAQSLHHDHGPARSAGLKSVWIDRRGGRSGGAARTPDAGVRCDARFETLAAFAAAAG